MKCSRRSGAEEHPGMGRRTRIGRVFEVDVWIDWSWFVALGLGTWTLLTMGPRLLPSMPAGELAVLALFASAGALAALLVHELARDLAARACGVPVRRVTLFLFGAVTDADRPAEGAPAPRRAMRAEAVAAAAAIGASVVAGVACLVGADAFSGELGRGGPASILLGWLGIANVLVAAVNLLPAYPLDGGRVLRAILWRATRDAERATRIAAWTSEVIGWLAVVVGASLVFASSERATAIGLWVTLAGWFLASTAAQAYERTYGRSGADAEAEA
jgi:Zn-dependent protease